MLLSNRRPPQTSGGFVCWSFCGNVAAILITPRSLPRLEAEGNTGEIIASPKL